LNPEKVTEKSYAVYPNANKTWTRGEDRLLLAMYQEGKDIKYISRKMGRSQTSIIMRLGKLGAG
jgi:DNA helicase-4